jgi:uncharacterized protein
MSKDLFVEIITKLERYTKATGVKRSLIHWHGGEPMLAGREFLAHAADLQNEHLSHVEVENTLQSNLCLYDGEVRDAVKDLLKDRWIGTCIDPFHPTRLLPNGKDYFHDCLKGLVTAQKDGFEVGMIYVVHGKSLEVVRDLYYFFVNTGVTSVLFHPLEEFDDPEYYLSSAQWGEFLMRLWDVWEEDDFTLKISPLADWKAFLTEDEPIQMCEYNVRCRENVLITVSPEGYLYPCHRFQDKGTHCIGHIAEMTFDEIVANPITHFIASKKENLVEECSACAYVDLCNSGCVATHDESGKTIWCEGLKTALEYVKDKLAVREFVSTKAGSED